MTAGQRGFSDPSVRPGFLGSKAGRAFLSFTLLSAALSAAVGAGKP